VYLVSSPLSFFLYSSFVYFRGPQGLFSVKHFRPSSSFFVAPPLRSSTCAAFQDSCSWTTFLTLQYTAGHCLWATNRNLWISGWPMTLPPLHPSSLSNSASTDHEVVVTCRHLPIFSQQSPRHACEGLKISEKDTSLASQCLAGSQRETIPLLAEGNRPSAWRAGNAPPV